MQAECVAPAGFGAGVSLRVIAYDQASPAVLFDYSPPHVSTVSGVSGLYADRASPVSITGLNFGLSTPVGDTLVLPNVTVLLGNASCGRVVWSAPTIVSCTSPEGLPMGENGVVVTITVQRGNATFVQASSPLNATFMCSPGSFGRNGTACRPCPANANCLGGVQPPVALPGAYALEGGEVFVPCSPPEACKGQLNGETGDAQVREWG